MIILHIIVGLNVGGAETMLNRLIDSHQENPKYRHVVVSLTNLGKLGTQFQSKGIEVHALNLRGTFGIPLTLWRLVNLIRNIKADIIQTWMYHADLLGGLAACIAGNRHVIWGIRTTDIRVGGSFGTEIVRSLCARLSSSIPQVIVCAAEASRQAHIAVGYDPKKMLVIPNGYNLAELEVSSDARQTLREQWGIDQDEIVVGSVGRFNKVKDQENFVCAAGLLAAQCSKLRFIMVGLGLNWENEQLVYWIDRSSCKDRFVVLGERDDVPRCLAAMDIFCLHSLTEGFPNALAEAMAMGLPCVATDVGDASLLLTNTGVIVPKGDSVALANGIKTLLALDQRLKKELGMRAKGVIVSKYSIASARERYEKIYQKVLEKTVC